MRIFTRYILREITSYALLGGALFTFILFMRYLLLLMELAVRGLASPMDLAKLVAYLLPSFLTLTLPMAVLVGILLGLSRLAADSEVTAMRASGFGVFSFVRIVSIVAIISWALGLFNSLYVAPTAAQALIAYLDESKAKQATVLVQPRVFSEDWKDHILYVQDVLAGANGTALWKNVFVADMSHPANPHIITSNEAVVLTGANQSMELAMSNGTRHDMAPDNPGQYDISTFATAELPIQTNQQEDMHLTRKDTPMHALSLHELREKMREPGDTRPYWIEFHSRFSFPAACLVLMLVGVPLGLSSKRGGKGTGFVVTLMLVLAYYVLSLIGTAFARSGKLPPVLGVWGANILFAVAGIVLIQQMSRGGFAVDIFSGAANLIMRVVRRVVKGVDNDHAGGGPGAWMQRLRRVLHIRFPLILDEYVMGGFLKNFALVLASLVVLFLIFTFFELIGDIVKNRTPLVTVGGYLLNLIPFVLYNVAPLCSLVAVLITFGALSRTSELTAMKATGTSLYRIVAPVLLIAAILAGGLFALDEDILPSANRRQDALRSEILNKQAQTFQSPGRQWMSGQTPHNGEPTRIFYYQYFDPMAKSFLNLTVFEFEPGSFHLTRRIFAASATWDDKVDRWVFENGWQRTFNGEEIGTYQPFTTSTFPEIREQPSYFKKEQKQSQEMSYSELSTYINDLQQSGFDTVRLRVQLNRKLAYPLITLVMAIIAIPFALSTGKRGSIAGMGTAVGIAIVYWVVGLLFENLGNVNSLPALMAAWSPDLLFAIAGSYLLLRSST